MSRMLLDPTWTDESFAEVVHAYTALIVNAQPQPDGPYLLLGWSFGGSLALAIASALESQGKTVAFLGLVDGLGGLDVDLHEPAPAEQPESRADFSQELSVLRVLAPGLDWDAIEQHHAALPGKAAASTYLQEVLSMVARERNVEVSSIVEILKDGGAADEVAHGKDVHRRADELEKQFVLQPLQVSPACWWSAQEMTPAKIKSLSDRLRAQVAGARLSDSIEIDASHERLVYHPTFIESAARKLAADRE
jgi:thioesterase domain-containing protein